MTTYIVRFFTNQSTVVEYTVVAKDMSIAKNIAYRKFNDWGHEGTLLHTEIIEKKC